MYKVLFHIDELTAGGAEKVLCNLVNNMDPSVFDITVHTTYKSDAGNLKNSSNIHYKYVFDQKSKLNRLIYRIEAQLGLFYQFHLKGDYELEVAYLECGPTKVMAASTNKKAAHIAWIHCDLAKKFSNMDKFAKGTAKYYKKYDKVICVSADCEKTYKQYFSDCAPSQVLYNVIDNDEIIAKSNEQLTIPIEKRKFTAIAVGRMTEQKNYMMLLKAHKRLCEEGLDYDLWFVGDGPESTKLKQFVSEQQLEHTVHFYGFQSNPYPIIKEADMIVCSSKYEGFSTVAIEASVLGVPMVTVDCTGMKEIFGNSEYGLITDNNDESLKQGMLSMIKDADMRKSYQVKSKKRAVLLSGKPATHITEQLFEKVMQENQRC